MPLHNNRDRLSFSNRLQKYLLSYSETFLYRDIIHQVYKWIFRIDPHAA